VRLYSNLLEWRKRPANVLKAAFAKPPTDSRAHPREYQHRLSEGQVLELTAAHHQQHESVKHLAQRFRIQRTTVATLLRRLGGLSR
jgi:AraC-like DNA-binding protein